MKKITFIFLSILPFSSFADDSKHMISFGRNGLGWSAGAEEIEGKSSSAFDSIEYFMNNLALNYAYRLGARFQIGGFFQNTKEKYTFERKGGGGSPSEIATMVVGITGIYNFSDDFTQAWYVGANVAHFNYEDEVSHDFANAEGKNPMEQDDTGEIYELFVGKRFSMKKWGINHITYSPNISVYHKKHGKDFKDQRATKGLGTTLQVLKFDVLF